jgi:5-methylcytosine-specific restriction endonuclease McrA
MAETDVSILVKQIEDRLFPGLGLDVWERVAYWHLFRRTHVEGCDNVVVGLDSLAIGTAMSTTKLRETLRSLQRKSCIAIDERSRFGHSVRVVLPDDIPGLPVSGAPAAPLDIETVDFCASRQFVGPLLHREENRCFYCLAALTADSTVLDHVVAQVNCGDNSYRNVVASCHICNARKQAAAPDDFLRMLYRDGFLSQADLQHGLERLAHLQAGLLVPHI